MKQMLPVCLVVWFAAAAQAGPAEASIVAAMRLSEQSNYSWVATVIDDARTYDIDGKTIRGGYTRVKMPVINSVRRRLGRSVTDTRIEVIFRGNERCVLETENGWKTVDELPWPAEDDAEFERIVSANNPPPSIGTIRGSGGGARITSPPVIGTRRRNPRDSEESTYSNLQLAIAHPHEDLGVIVSSHREWQVEGDVVSGTLTELGAQLLLVRDGQKEIEPLRAAGTFKLWIRDGMVTKFQVRLEGVLSVTTKSGRRKIDVTQTTHTQLKDVGTTKFEVPDEARRKLGA